MDSNNAVARRGSRGAHGGWGSALNPGAASPQECCWAWGKSVVSVIFFCILGSHPHTTSQKFLAAQLPPPPENFCCRCLSTPYALYMHFAFLEAKGQLSELETAEKKAEAQ